jgi:hypothetical protein
LHERAAEDAGQMTSELFLEPRAGASTVTLHEPFDGGAVLE